MATPASEDSRSGPSEPLRPPKRRKATRDERAAAVATWLLQAADDISFARAQWEDIGGALLHCGTLFAAVCMPDWMVHEAAGTADPDKVGVYLKETLEGGPVFQEERQGRYYALTPPSAEDDWEVESTTFLGRRSVLVVPSPALSVPGEGLAYWSVPMDGPGDLCQAGRLAMLADIGKARVEWREGLGGIS
jgi:hypothetical protein